MNNCLAHFCGPHDGHAGEVPLAQPLNDLGDGVGGSLAAELEAHTSLAVHTPELKNKNAQKHPPKILNRTKL